MRLNERTAFSFVIFLFAAVLLYQTMDMRDDATLVPRIFGTLLLFFSGIQVLIDIFPAVEQRLSFLGQKAGMQTMEQAPAEEETEELSAFATYLFFAWIAGFVALIYFTSMMWATVTSLFVYLKLIHKESWTLSLLYCAGVALFIYLVFVLGFELEFFL